MCNYDDNGNIIYTCDNHPYKQHYLVCYTHSEIAVCDKGNVTACLPSWNMYDQLKDEVLKYFVKAEQSTSIEEYEKFKRLEKMFYQKAQDILDHLNK